MIEIKNQKRAFKIKTLQINKKVILGLSTGYSHANQGYSLL